MKKVNKTMESVLKKVVNHMVDTELYGWPPQCTSFLYQPVRPKRTGNDALKENDKVRK